MKWVLFNLFVLAMLALDLFVFHRKSHVIKFKEAIMWSVIWISLALLFNLGIYFWHERHSEAALEFLTGYLIEESLSVDNLFVFLLLFSFFRVPAHDQHRVLFWGILGAILMRAAFILVGVALIKKFEWVIYIFGAILVISGIKLAVEKDKEVHPEKNPVLRLFRRFFPVTEGYEGSKFFVKRGTRSFATPLFVVLLAVETTDVIFAVDSIPAVLAITRDPFLVYTSNIFAVLGLRSIYFALAGLMQLFHYLHYGLAFILVFVGVKMLIGHYYKMPIAVALEVVLGVLVISVIASLLSPRKTQ